MDATPDDEFSEPVHHGSSKSHGKAPLWLMVIATAIAAAVGSTVVQSIFRAMEGPAGSADIDKVLVQVADTINRNLPMMVDKHTRGDSTVPLPGNKLMYCYTIVDFDPVPTAEEVEQTLRPVLLNSYKTSDEMATLRDLGVTLVYRYSDEAGNQIGKFEISPDDF